jgi:hypothetical protein
MSSVTEEIQRLQLRILELEKQKEKDESDKKTSIHHNFNLINDYHISRNAERDSIYNMQDALIKKIETEPVPASLIGKLWKEYNDLFRRLRFEDDVSNSCEGAHRLQDEIYRKFVNDLFEGKFQTNAEIKAMTLLMKIDVVNYDKPGHWWYA